MKRSNFFAKSRAPKRRRHVPFISAPKLRSLFALCGKWHRQITNRCLIREWHFPLFPGNYSQGLPETGEKILQVMTRTLDDVCISFDGRDSLTNPSPPFFAVPNWTIIHTKLPSLFNHEKVFGEPMHKISEPLKRRIRNPEFSNLVKHWPLSY